MKKKILCGNCNYSCFSNPICYILTLVFMNLNMGKNKGKENFITQYNNNDMVN